MVVDRPHRLNAHAWIDEAAGSGKQPLLVLVKLHIDYMLDISQWVNVRLATVTTVFLAYAVRSV